MKKILFVIFLLLILPFVLSDFFGIFDTPPPTIINQDANITVGYITSIYGGDYYGDINMFGNSIYNVTINGTMIFGVNATEILGLNESISQFIYWNRTNNNLYPKNIGDNVGIGTKNPKGKLNIYGEDVIFESGISGIGNINFTTKNIGALKFPMITTNHSAMIMDKGLYLRASGPGNTATVLFVGKSATTPNIKFLYDSDDTSFRLVDIGAGITFEVETPVQFEDNVVFQGDADFGTNNHIKMGSGYYLDLYADSTTVRLEDEIGNDLLHWKTDTGLITGRGLKIIDNGYNAANFTNKGIVFPKVPNQTATSTSYYLCINATGYVFKNDTGCRI